MGTRKTVLDSAGRQFEGTELCSRDFSLPRFKSGCGSAFFLSPQQASSWRWRRLPPRGGAFPPWARGPPRCRDPRSLKSRDPPPVQRGSATRASSSRAGSHTPTSCRGAAGLPPAGAQAPPLAVGGSPRSQAVGKARC